MLFAEIPGMDEVKESLIGSVKRNHIAHAQLFSGSEGSANLALAIAYAQFINCTERQENDSCGQCASCTKYNKLIHPDLHFIFPVSTTKKIAKDPQAALFMPDWRHALCGNPKEGKKGNPYQSLHDWGQFIGAENKQLIINAEESRNIIKTLSLKAYEAEYKVMIIWLPESMRHEAANAILKILEEPPYKTIFILATHNIEKIISTILSRTQLVPIRRFSDEETQGELMRNFELDPKRAQTLSYLADGDMNMAFHLAHEMEDDHHSIFRDWMRLCYKNNNLLELAEWTEVFQKLGRESQKNLLQYGLTIMREILVYKHTREQLLRLNAEEKEFVSRIASVTTDGMIDLMSQRINDAYYHIERNANPRMTFMDTSLFISNLFDQFKAAKAHS